MARTLINVPATAKRGEVIEIKTLISHPMETGYRTGPDGALIPRDIIHRFVCTYNGEEIFRADLFPAIAANPFIAFSTVATESGEIALSWTDEKGQTQRETGEDHGRMSVWHRFLPLLVLLALAGPGTGSAEADDRRSGFDFMGPQTQAMQSDDTSNPGMLAVLEGEELWNRKAGDADKSCADCHGDAARSMRGVAARLPGLRHGNRRPDQPGPAHQPVPGEEPGSRTFPLRTPAKIT